MKATVDRLLPLTTAGAPPVLSMITFGFHHDEKWNKIKSGEFFFGS
jgi:hypothetical protein